MFPYPYTVPQEGYVIQKYWYSSFFVKSYKTNINEKHCFIRIRTQLDDQGNVISAYYGRIDNPAFVSGMWKNVVLDLSYTINLILNDRNLEFANDFRGRKRALLDEK